MAAARWAGAANDSCPFAQTVALTGPAPSVTTVLAQSTVSATDSTAGSCSATIGGPDVVYRLVITTESEVKLKVTPSGGLTPAVYLRRTCGSGAASNELACGVGTSSLLPVEAVRTYVKPVECRQGRFSRRGSAHGGAGQ